MDMHEHVRSISKSMIKDYKVEKVSKMPSFRDSLNANELEQLVAYLSSLRPKEGAQ